MATASTPYFERQWILNVSHVWMVVRMLVDQSKLFLVVREICPPRRSCRSSRSSKACAEPDQPIDRSNRSVATARNGRRAISVDGPRRILSGQSDMTGCAPASRCTMGTSYRLTGCEGPKRRQHAVLRAAPAAIFGWLVLRLNYPIGRKRTHQDLLYRRPTPPKILGRHIPHPGPPRTT